MGSSRVFLRVSGGLAVLLLYCSPLFAYRVSYTLNTRNSQLSSSPGMYGTVGLTLKANGTSQCFSLWRRCSAEVQSTESREEDRDSVSTVPSVLLSMPLPSGFHAVNRVVADMEDSDM
jgi:hypothetical protein